MRKIQFILMGWLLALSSNALEVVYQDSFDNDGLGTNTGIGGGAINKTIANHSWTDDGDATFSTSGTSYMRRAILYSENTFQSDSGFKLTVYYTTGIVGDSAAHNLSFGLISTDTDLSTYSGLNLFSVATGVYGLGANVTTDASEAKRGLNFADGSTVTSLDAAGDNVQFIAGSSTPVVIEIDADGAWTYSIDGITEASGTIAEGFDLTKSYHFVVYGQDDNGGGKSIQSVELETLAPDRTLSLIMFTGSN